MQDKSTDCEFASGWNMETFTPPASLDEAAARLAKLTHDKILHERELAVHPLPSGWLPDQEYARLQHLRQHHIRTIKNIEREILLLKHWQGKRAPSSLSATWSPEVKSLRNTARSLYGYLVQCQPGFRETPLAAEARLAIWGHEPPDDKVVPLESTERRSQSPLPAGVGMAALTGASSAGAALIADLSSLIKTNERRQVGGCWINNRLLTEWLSKARGQWSVLLSLVNETPDH